MKQIDLNSLNLYLAEGSIRREKISDELYFSARYKHCTSNSRLKWIKPENPEAKPELYFNPPIVKSKSLQLGKNF